MALALAVTPFYDCPPPGAASPFTVCFRARMGPLPTTLLEVVLVIAIAVGLFAAAGRVPWWNPYTWPALVVIAGATLGAIFTPDHRAALGLWKAYFVEPVLAGVVVAWLARLRYNARLLLAALALAGVVVAVLNLAAFAIEVLRHVDVVKQPAVVLYRTPNAIPLFLVPIQAFTLSIALFGDDRRERAVAAAFFVLASIADVTSLSRGGWLGLVAAVIVVGLFSPRRAWVGAGVAVLAVAALAVPGTRRRILVEFEPNSPDNSVQLRWALWRSAVNLLRHQPVFGGGLSGFQRSVRPFADPAYHEQLIDPHNLMLNWWSETGFVGLAGFIWMLIQVLRTAVRGLDAGPWPRALSIGLVGLVAAVLAHGLVDVPYFKNDLAVEFWALLGLQLGATARTSA
jgi:putative inorganic carbon (HCO3(-)) transporter